MSYGVNVELQSQDTVIISRFKSLINFEEISNLLEIPVEFLWKILIRDKKNL